MTKNMKVAVFTGTRAEYGLLYWLLKDIQSDPDLILQLLVSGMHLSPEFGETFRQIEKDGFPIAEKIEILLSSDNPVGTAKSVGLGILGFSDALSRLTPDVLVVLGDRFEALAVAQTAMFLRIPIMHLHGGEITEGAYDDSIRHVITKLSYLHGTSTEIYRERVIQLGESPDRVFNVGALGLDHLLRGCFMSVQELSESLNFELNKRYLIVTYHPATLADEDAESTFIELLDALDNFSDYQVIFTYPNADDGGQKIITLLKAYSEKDPRRTLVIPSLGHRRYLSAVKFASAVIGNSSSGIIEVPALRVPTVNIGARQAGRLAAESVINCVPKKCSIVSAINMALSKDYKNSKGKINNPYGQGNASQQIIEILKSFSFSAVKKFHNIKVLK
jgi:UDP-hydrolysing UDP-N-acetyl-D-glucosamine 2-epimerase